MDGKPTHAVHNISRGDQLMAVFKQAQHVYHVVCNIRFPACCNNGNLFMHIQCVCSLIPDRYPYAMFLTPIKKEGGQKDTKT